VLVGEVIRLKSPEDTSEGMRARSRLLTQMRPRKGNASAQKTLNCRRVQICASAA